MPIQPGEGLYDAMVRLLEVIAGTGGGGVVVQGPRVLPDILGTASAAAAETKMPAGTVCSGFFLTNRHATLTLHWAGGSVDAELTSAFVLPMQTIYVPAGLDDVEGLSTIGSGAGVVFTITPIG